MAARRYSAVPWLTDADLMPSVNDMITARRGDDEIAHTLEIKRPFGAGSDTTLTIHAFRSGGIYIAEGDAPIGEEIEPAQSNPNRIGEDDED